MSVRPKRVVWYSVFISGLLLVACCGLPVTEGLREEPLVDSAAVSVESFCPTEKIAFTQDTGCLNDGSFEFCVPTENLNAMALVRQIVPQAECGPHRGRAGCDLETEVLCMVSIDRMCIERHGAMTDGGWQTVCDLAALPHIREIVPTWYE